MAHSVRRDGCAAKPPLRRDQQRGRSLAGQQRSVRAPQSGYRPKVDGGKGPAESQESDAAIAKRVIGPSRARTLHGGGVTALFRNPVDIVVLGKIHVDVKKVRVLFAENNGFGRLPHGALRETKRPLVLSEFRPLTAAEGFEGGFKVVVEPVDQVTARRVVWFGRIRIGGG